MTFGRLERTTGAPPMSDINMTPLIDVMLVLLVIFMITAPLLVGKVRVELPKATGTSKGQAPAFLRVSIDQRGDLFLDDQACAPSCDATQVQTRLQQAFAHDSNTEVQLRADRGVPYGRVVEVMGLAHQAGLTRIAFVADAAPAPGAKVAPVSRPVPAPAAKPLSQPQAPAQAPAPTALPQ